MRKVLYAVFVTGLFVLMLSALVVSPETADAQSAWHQPADLRATFRPVVSAVMPDAAVPASRISCTAALCALPVLLLCTAPLSAVRDANGHVLSAVRYENSVYQLFRPEVAGG